MPVIYLVPVSPPESIGLPPEDSDEQSSRSEKSENTPVYMAFQPTGFARLAGHPATGELLPRHFTLILIKQDGMFSVALSVRQVFQPECLPVRKCCALCCPDFPLFTKCQRATGYYTRLQNYKKIPDERY